MLKINIFGCTIVHRFHQPWKIRGKITGKFVINIDIEILNENDPGMNFLLHSEELEE